MFSARYSSGVLGVGYGIFAFARDQLRMMFFEAVGDVLQEDETEDDMLVLRRVHVAPAPESFKFF